MTDIPATQLTEDERRRALRLFARMPYASGVFDRRRPDSVGDLLDALEVVVEKAREGEEANEADARELDALRAQRAAVGQFIRDALDDARPDTIPPAVGMTP